MNQPSLWPLPAVNRIHQGDTITVLKSWPESFVQCVVTSPPYWSLRNYGVKGQLGLEKSPFEYIENMMRVFREVRRVLRPDGTLWLNMGDSYISNSSNGWQGKNSKKMAACQLLLRPTRSRARALRTKT